MDSIIISLTFIVSIAVCAAFFSVLLYRFANEGVKKELRSKERRAYYSSKEYIQRILAAKERGGIKFFSSDRYNHTFLPDGDIAYANLSRKTKNMLYRKYGIFTEFMAHNYWICWYSSNDQNK